MLPKKTDRMTGKQQEFSMENDNNHLAKENFLCHNYGYICYEILSKDVKSFEKTIQKKYF